IIVGTRSPSFGAGTIEVWTSASHSTPAYSRVQLIPPSGSVPGNNLGEVTAIKFGDLNKDGTEEMVVGTQSGLTSGNMIYYKSKSGGTFTFDVPVTSAANGVVTSLGHTDLNADGIE